MSRMAERDKSSGIKYLVMLASACRRKIEEEGGFVVVGELETCTYVICLLGKTNEYAACPAQDVHLRIVRLILSIT